LNAFRRPDFGGWGGRYVYRQPYGETHAIWTQGGDAFGRVTSQDTVVGVDGVEHVSDQATIWRWREAFQNDFAARMGWTIADYAHASHNPLVEVNGIPGTQVIEMNVTWERPWRWMQAAASIRTANAAFPLVSLWEAGVADGNLAAVTLTDAETSRVTVQADSACRPMWLPLIPCKGAGTAHIILAVTGEVRRGSRPTGASSCMCSRPLRTMGPELRQRTSERAVAPRLTLQRPKRQLYLRVGAGKHARAH